MHLDIKWQFIQSFILQYNSLRTMRRDLGTWLDPYHDIYLYFKMQAPISMRIIIALLNNKNFSKILAEDGEIKINNCV